MDVYECEDAQEKFVQDFGAAGKQGNEPWLFGLTQS